MTFDFYLGGFFHDHSYRLILNGDTLSISDYAGVPIPEHDKTIAVNGNQDWFRLVEFLKKCRWKKRYESEMLDGTQFEIKVQGNGINLKSYGSNAYPDDFDEFLKLLNKIVINTGVCITK